MNHARVATMTQPKHSRQHHIRDMMRERNYSSLYLKNLAKTLEANATRAASIQFRKDALQAAVRSNHINEYQRIKGLLSQSILRGTSRQHLDERLKTLERLGASAV